MTIWPSSIEKCTTHSFSINKAQNRSAFESGYVYSGAKHTSTRQKFDISWAYMNATSMASLVDFFDVNLGATFIWTNPTLDVAHTVRFTEDSIDFGYANIGSYWNVKVMLEEI